MNKQDVIKAMSKDTGLTINKAKEVLESTLSNIMNTVSGNGQLDLPDFKNSNRINLVGFGTFEKIIRKPRTFRNPQTREIIKLGEKASIKFRPSQQFKDFLNSPVK